MKPGLTRPREAGGMEDRYVLMSGTGDFDGVIRGTAAECSMGYCEIMGHELRVERDEDGDWFYSRNTTGDEDDWEEYDRVPCDGDREEALGEAHRWFFLDYLNDADSLEGSDLVTVPEEEAGAFLLDYDELLGFITAREVRDYCLDLDEEFETRLWFHENRGKRKAA